jgi:hypothetical protein
MGGCVPHDTKEREERRKRNCSQHPVLNQADFHPTCQHLSGHDETGSVRIVSSPPSEQIGRSLL